MRFKLAVSGLVLAGLSQQAIALDLGDVSQQQKPAQPALQAASPYCAKEYQDKRWGSLPNGLGEQLLKKCEDSHRNYQSDMRRTRGEQNHSDDDCAAAKQLLPDNIKRMAAIRVAGFAIEPMACTGQETLDMCFSREGDGKFYTTLCKSDWNGNNAGSSIVELASMQTPSNGKVIVRVHYLSPVMPEYREIKAFHKDDAVYQRLVSKYGEPINVRNAPEPYEQLVWASKSFNFTARLTNSRLDILLALDALLPELSQSLDKAYAADEQAKREQTRQAVRQVNVPQF